MFQRDGTVWPELPVRLFYLNFFFFFFLALVGARQRFSTLASANTGQTYGRTISVNLISRYGSPG